MPGARLIGDYLAQLSAELPARIVDELADGLDEAYRCYLGQARTRMPPPGPPVAIAVALSAGRSGFAVRSFPHALAR